MNHERYLSRIGLENSELEDPNLESLKRLQRAHVTSVPFETLSITGDPFGNREGEGVSLSLPHLYDKIVKRDRGGFCYELNAVFGWLLNELGFEVEKRAARVVSDVQVPANHLTHVVSLDERYIVDVGLGSIPMRRPLTLDGEVYEDKTGTRWRIVESERADADYVSQFKEPNDDDWSDRYVFRDVPRQLSFFEATCEYLQTAPESPFTGDPVATIATQEGYKKLRLDEIIHVEKGEEERRDISEEEWYQILEDDFGVRYVE